jgi:hypothetical protein
MPVAWMLFVTTLCHFLAWIWNSKAKLVVGNDGLTIVDTLLLHEHSLHFSFTLFPKQQIAIPCKLTL